jgi:hypothetical protein
MVFLSDMTKPPIASRQGAADVKQAVVYLIRPLLAERAFFEKPGTDPCFEEISSKQGSVPGFGFTRRSP